MSALEKTNLFVLDIEREIETVQAELAAIAPALERAKQAADADRIIELRAQERALNAKLLQAAADGRKRIREHQSDINQKLQPKFKAAETAIESGHAALEKLRADFIEAERKALDELKQAEQRLHDLRNDGGWTTGRLWDADQALAGLVSQAAERV